MLEILEGPARLAAAAHADPSDSSAIKLPRLSRKTGWATGGTVGTAWAGGTGLTGSIGWTGSAGWAGRTGTEIGTGADC